MENTLLSVVVPVYNTEKYLDKCIKSIINQSYKNLEIFLIDDGSTDNSGEICDKYAENDSRISVIHQSNGGQNRARKAGIDKSKGKYVTFVDSDDWLEPDLYEELFRQMNGEDYELVTSDFYIDYDDSTLRITTNYNQGNYLREDIVEKILPQVIWNYRECCQSISASLCGRFFLLDKLKKSFEDINYNMRICEDAVIIYPYIIASSKMLVTHLCKYHYIQHEGSAVHSLTTDSFNSVLAFEKYFINKLNEFEQKNIITAATRENIYNQLVQLVALKLRLVIKDVYNINMNPFRWCPPFERLPRGSNVVIYGAGGVGRAFYHTLNASPNYSVALWVDKNYEEIEGVSNPQSILSTEYDIILISVAKEEVAKDIRQELVEMGVNERKILWTQPAVVSPQYTCFR